MVEVTETNRNPDIDAEVINASSVSADSGTVGTLEATDASVENAPSQNTDVARKNEVDAKADADANVESFSTGGAENTVPVSQGNGTLAMAEVGGGFEQMDVFESDGTFDASDVDLAFIQVVGGGGSGAGAEGTDPATGGSGGTSSFGSFMSATGGSAGDALTGGVLDTFNLATGGSGSGGDINIDGGQSKQGWIISDSAVGGSGGGTVFAAETPGGGGGDGGNDDGEPGSFPGGGGSGVFGNGATSGGGGGGFASGFVDLSATASVSVTVGLGGSAINNAQTADGGDGADGVVIVRY